MPRIPSKPAKPRHDPLHVDLQQDDALHKYGRLSKPSKKRTEVEDDEGGEGVSYYSI
jgi:essential nuclear protein 1